MIHSPCDSCAFCISDCMKDEPKCGKDIVFCDHCGKGWEWEKLPVGYQLVHYTCVECHGFKYVPEVEGFQCPGCDGLTKL
jgi:hypothetical protein